MKWYWPPLCLLMPAQPVASLLNELQIFDGWLWVQIDRGSMGRYFMVGLYRVIWILGTGVLQCYTWNCTSSGSARLHTHTHTEAPKGWIGHWHDGTRFTVPLILVSQTSAGIVSSLSGVNSIADVIRRRGLLSPVPRCCRDYHSSHHDLSLRTSQATPMQAKWWQ